MHFQKLSWNEAEQLIHFHTMLTGHECDPTAGCTLMWRNACRMDYCIDNDSLYIRLHDDSGIPHYALPVSRNHEAAVIKLVTECKDDGPMLFTTIPETHTSLFQRLYPDCSISEQRDYADYLYSSEKLISLAGRKLSGQRNQMSQFKRNHPDWQFLPLTDHNLSAVIEYLKEEFINNPEIEEVKKEEDRMALDMLEHLNLCPLSGGVLTAENRILGFAAGEIVHDTLYVHIEKADRTEKGAYQMVVNQFSIMYGGNVNWINREDDSGDEGLRKAKLAYLPDRLLAKYLISIP